MKTTSQQPLEWLKSKRLTIPNVCQHEKHLKFSCLAGGSIKLLLIQSFFESCMSVFFKVKYASIL